MVRQVGADFEQNVADYGFAVAVAILAVLVGLWSIYAARRDVKDAHRDASRSRDEFTHYLREVGERQTEALLASARASTTAIDTMRSESARSEKRHLEVVTRLERIEGRLHENRPGPLERGDSAP